MPSIISRFLRSHLPVGSLGINTISPLLGRFSISSEILIDFGLTLFTI